MEAPPLESTEHNKPNSTSQIYVAVKDITNTERAKIMDDAEQALVQYTVPLAPQRTNLYDASTDRHRSVLFGIHTTRGVNITRATFEQSELLQALHLLATTRPKSRR
eukprot:1028915-Amphidinium_carterae.1